MAELTCQFVRPDKLIYEGLVKSLVLVTRNGELGVWPGHANEICSLGDGIVRLHHLDEDGGATDNVVVSGGYAEIGPKGVIILADHARLVNDIDTAVVIKTRDKAIAGLENLKSSDHRKSYLEQKIKWCNMLLKVEKKFNAR
jgi:ATP synthase F1, epsilon subunit